jgi:hypothetical protein
MFWRHFLLNETARFGQNNTVSSTIKKKPKHCCLELHYRSSSFPRHAEAREEEVSLPYNTTLSLSPPPLAQTLT